MLPLGRINGQPALIVPLRLLARYASDLATSQPSANLSTISSAAASTSQRQSLPNDGLDLSHFINQARGGPEQLNASLPSTSAFNTMPSRQVFIETYGCQMNVNDSEVVHSVLRDAGFTAAPSAEAADVVLLNTCAIRDNAESKIWQRLGYFKNLKVARRTTAKKAAKLERQGETAAGLETGLQQGGLLFAPRPVVGVLGCMAERLKHRLLESEKMVDLVAGPDAYRDLPRLINIVEGSGGGAGGGVLEAPNFAGELPLPEAVGEQNNAVGAPNIAQQGSLSSKGSNESSKGRRKSLPNSSSSATAINVQLSLDETYADVVPVRPAGSRSVFLSIMRGCNNMCAFCVVPFTRGRERSRPLQSILDEVRMLSDSGVKELTLLGQNVNSYADFSQQQLKNTLNPLTTTLLSTSLNRISTTSTTSTTNTHSNSKEEEEVLDTAFETHYARGFRSVYRPRRDGAVSFAELLDRVADIDPEMRIRFTSPHPKEFSNDVLSVLSSRSNVCKQLHMPAQSGSSSVLERMRRGYTREAYDELVNHVRATLPGVALSTDMISGFCGETEEEHAASVDLLRAVRYDLAFLFAYSEREKTHAARNFEDNVPQETKIRRLQELIDAYRNGIYAAAEEEVGRRHLILVEGPSRRSHADLTGRTDTYKRVVFPDLAVPSQYHFSTRIGMSHSSTPAVHAVAGDYVAVQIVGAGGGTLQAVPLARTTLAEFVAVHGSAVPMEKFPESGINP